MAMPPARGIGCVLMRRAAGWSTAPIFSDQRRTLGVTPAVTKAATRAATIMPNMVSSLYICALCAPSLSSFAAFQNVGGAFELGRSGRRREHKDTVGPSAVGFA